MTLPAPFGDYVGEVLPAWIDSNDHMNLAYYIVLFDHGTDAIYDAMGIGVGYKQKTNCGTFAAESHILYEQELLLGDRVKVVSTVVGIDAKRMHLAHEMYRLSDGKRAACQEILYLHVDLGRRRVAPWPADRLAMIQSVAAAHAAARPDWVGRRISLPAVKG